MLKDRRQLENELTKYLVGIDKTKIVNRKLQQQWYTQLSGEYNIPMVDSSDYLSLRKDLSGAKSLETSTVKMLYDELENHSGVCQDIIDKYTFNMNTLKRWVIMYEDYLHDC